MVQSGEGEKLAFIPETAAGLPPETTVYLNGGLFAARSAYARFSIHEIAVHRTCWF
jgi:hypothetical protein